MKALSIQQPWLDLILSGRKTIEIRRWRTDYRGLLLLHASRTVDTWACEDFGISRESLQTGKVLAVAYLATVMQLTKSNWANLHDQAVIGPEFEGGYYGWVLRDVRRLTIPIPRRGALGLFDVPDEMIEEGYR
jgi:hypothetical protein